MKAKFFAIFALMMLALIPSALAGEYPESEHPYAPNTDQTWTYTYPKDIEYMKVSFTWDTILGSDHCDYLSITDSDGNEKKYYDLDLQWRTLYFKGNTITLRLVSNDTENYNGFRIDSIEEATKEEYDSPHFAVSPDGYLNKYEGEAVNLVVPSVINGVEIKSIEREAFAGNTYLQTITLPDTVTFIGRGAFCYCTALSAVSLPSNLETINDYAFESCTELVSISFPAGLKRIGRAAFNRCNSLQSIQIPDTVTFIDAWTFSGCQSLTLAKLPDGIEYIPDYFFNGCYNLQSISIPNSVITIGEDAFAFCKSLVSIDLPDSVTELGNSSFTNCHKLKSIRLSQNLQSIGGGAFSVCLSLESIRIPASVTSISSNPFSDCSRLTNIEIDPDNTSFRNEQGGILRLSDMQLVSYPAAKIGDYTVPEGTTAITDSAFMSCVGLTGITIPDSVQTIGNNAFRGCTSLTQVTIPDSVTSLGAYAFYECSQLTDIKLSNRLSQIGRCTFAYCSRLQYIEIPDSITSIGNEAFNYCGSLRTVILPSNTPDIADDAFSNCNQLDLQNPGPKPTEEIITSGSCGPQATWVLDQDNVLVISGTGSITRNYDRKWPVTTIRRIVIEPGITEIGSSMFQGCSSLIDISIPSTVTKIGNIVFDSCSSLSDITIPEGVVSLGNRIFQNCPGISKIVLPNSLTEISGGMVWIHTYFMSDPPYTVVANIDSEAARIVSGWGHTFRAPGIPAELIYTFENDEVTGLSIVHADTDIQSFAFPNEVTGIYPYAFRGCSQLKEITIPSALAVVSEGAFADCENLKSVYFRPGTATIGKFAFYNCKSLTDVHFDGTDLQWAKVSIGSGNEAFLSAACHLIEVNRLVLPSSLTTIESEAFASLANIDEIVIPASVTYIADDAFSGSDISLIVEPGSYAASWAQKNGINYMTK